MILALLPAFATPPADFVPLKTTDTCTIAKREKTATLGAAMWARCTWPDVPPERVHALLIDLDHYEDWIWPIGDSRVEREEGGVQIVYQRQHIWGLSDREVLLRVQIGGDEPAARVAWEAANDLPLELDRGSIRTPINTGHWTSEPAEGGGVIVTHQIEVNAGGIPLPGWLMRAIQTRGFSRLLTDLREAARPQPAKR